MNNFMQQVAAFRQNVMQNFSSVGVQLPSQVVNDPNAIIQMLMNSGQLSQQQYNQASQIAEQFKNQFR